VKWFEGPSFRAVHFPAGGILNTHTPTGCAVAQGSRVVCPDGRIRAVSRFYDHGAPCYVGAWSGSVRIGGRTVRGRVYIWERIDPYAAALRFAPDAE